MAQTEQPSYTELVHQVLQAAEQPLTFQEIFDAVGQRRPITTRNPKGTIRGALGQGPQLVNVGDGRYWYLPYCLRGSLLRLVLVEKKPANQPILLDHEILHALSPGFFDSARRQPERPMRGRLPTGQEVELTPSHTGGYGWAIPLEEPLRRYLVDQRAAAGDALLIRLIDVENALADIWFESRLRRPDDALAVRNRELADAAYAFMRQRPSDQWPIWDVAIALLARGLYRADVPPDPLRAVLKADRRFDIEGLSGFDGRLASLAPALPIYVSLNAVPEPPAVALPAGALYQIKVTLRGSNPPIWRRLVVAADTRLSTLHNILQAAMGWENDHLHGFQVGRRWIGEPAEDPWHEADGERKLKLSDVAPAAKSKLRYQYDFGDSWDHDIVVEKVLPPESDVQAPACIAGARACPPEDVGGVWGYQWFLEAIQDPSHPEHEERLEWVGDNFDPEAFDPEKVNAVLSRLRSRRGARR
jgi:hypothetical protein